MHAQNAIERVARVFAPAGKAQTYEISHITEELRDKTGT